MIFLELRLQSLAICDSKSLRFGSLSKIRLQGGFQMGGFPDLDLSFLFCPFLSFLGLSRFFRDFPDLLRDGPGIFPIRPLFSFSAY